MASVKQVSPASRKTRGSSLIVNGEGSIPANMMGIVGVELRNFINPDLCWKTVSKGYRSGRSRKTAAKGSKLNSDGAPKDPRLVADTKISESEKLGVAVLGQHFSEIIEHVPIKKRRFMVRSLSPPHLEDNEQCIDCKQASRKRHCCPKLVLRKQYTLTDTLEVTGSRLVSGESLDGMNGKLGDNEDFSGIEILADVACNNIMVGDATDDEEKAVVEKSTREGSDRSTIAIPMEETTTSIETVNSSTKDMVYDNRKEDSSSHDDLTENIGTDKDRSTRCSVSSRDVRLHWDLNVAMEVWEQSCEITGVGPRTDVGEVIPMDCKQQTEEVNEIQKDSTDSKHALCTEVQFMINNEEHKLEVCSGIDKFNHECGPTNNVLKASTNVAIDAQDPFPGFDNITEKLMPDEDGASSHNAPVKQITEVENSEHAFPCASVSEGTASGIVKDSGEDSNEASGLQDDFNVPQQSSMCGCDPAVQVEEIKSVGKAEENCEDAVSFSGASVGDGQPIVSTDGKEQVDKASLSTSQEYGNDSASHLGKVTINDRNNDNYYWDSHHNAHDLVGNENTMDLQAGYDSQYEDGELREIDMEIDYVDNESDECDIFNVDALGNSLSGRPEMSSKYKEERLWEVDNKNVEVNMKLEMRGLGPESEDVTENIKHSAAESTLRESPVSSKTKPAASTKTSQVTNGITRRHTADSALRVDDKDSHTKEVGSIELELSCDGESLSSASLHRSYDMLEQMNRPSNSKLCTQEVKEVMGRERSDLGYWDSETRELPPTDHGSSGSERHRPRSVIESRGCSVVSELAMLDNPSQQSIKNSFSSELYRPPRRRSLANMNHAYNGHMGMVPARDFSPDRRRFRRNQPGDRRTREECCRSRAEDTANEYCLPQRIRKHSFSPPGRGFLNNFARPYGKTYSNSRSRSPLRRERNDRRSRSPDYRFTGRIDRARFPFQKPRFAEDEEIRFMSFPRHRFSPRRNSKWIGDPNSDVDHFGSRRLPFKIFRQGQGFDSARSHRRSDSHDYFEPVIHPGRFSEINRSYESSDDVRHNRGGRSNVPRARRFNGGDLERRFRYDEAHSFVSRNSRAYDDLNRITDRRPREVSRIRRANEEKGHFRFNHDRTFNTSPKSFTMHDA